MPAGSTPPDSCYLPLNKFIYSQSIESIQVLPGGHLLNYLSQVSTFPLPFPPRALYRIQEYHRVTLSIKPRRS